MITIDLTFGFVSGIVVGCMVIIMLIHAINEIKEGGVICEQMGKNNE